jgi:hypothetical protein
MFIGMKIQHTGVSIGVHEGENIDGKSTAQVENATRIYNKPFGFRVPFSRQLSMRIQEDYSWSTLHKKAVKIAKTLVEEGYHGRDMLSIGSVIYDTGIQLEVNKAKMYVADKEYKYKIKIPFADKSLRIGIKHHA